MSAWIIVAALLGANVGFAVGWAMSFARRAESGQDLTLEDAEQ